jgi:hypothetical protein
MKLVREHINEKFTEKSDPIKDMGIGLYVKRYFETPQEYAEFMYNNLAAILRKPKIPDDILYSEDLFINKEYGRVLHKYIDTYVSLASRFNGWEYQLLHKILKKKGFKKKSI